MSTQATESDAKGKVALDDLRLLNIGEVATMLGVSVRHVRRLVFEDRIPYLKWGRLVRFDPRDLSDWLRTLRRRP